MRGITEYFLSCNPYKKHMKRLVVITIFLGYTVTFSQSKTELINHFQNYYQLMKAKGDIQGVINGLTHLDILQPSQARKDTLAYMYFSSGRNIEALNTVGIEKNASDSDMTLEVKALALKNVGAILTFMRSDKSLAP